MLLPLLLFDEDETEADGADGDVSRKRATDEDESNEDTEDGWGRKRRALTSFQRDYLSRQFGSLSQIMQGR